MRRLVVKDSVEQEWIEKVAHFLWENAPHAEGLQIELHELLNWKEVPDEYKRRYRDQAKQIIELLEHESGQSGDYSKG